MALKLRIQRTNYNYHTDVVVEKNNIDDSKILAERLDTVIEKTPSLNELHTDGGYGSKEIDEKMEKNGITLITTAIRGRKSSIETIIELSPENADSYVVKCPFQSIVSEPTNKKHKAVFDKNKCANCILNEQCSIQKNNHKLYFANEDYLRDKRNRNILKIPAERRKIRPNVEATMKEFKTKTNAGKLKVRGLFKAKVFAYAVAIGINFGRIMRYISSEKLNFMQFSNFFVFILFSLTHNHKTSISRN